MTSKSKRYQMYNSQSRRYEDVDLEIGEFSPGETVLVLYFANDSYVTIPGASLYKFNANLELELAED